VHSTRTMASERGASLAIRTVLVTTRSAVRQNIAAGKEEVARAAARRGLRMLDELAGPVAASPDTTAGEQLAAARAELQAVTGSDPAESARRHHETAARR
jgi:hypothetical protein